VPLPAWHRDPNDPAAAPLTPLDPSTAIESWHADVYFDASRHDAAVRDAIEPSNRPAAMLRRFVQGASMDLDDKGLATRRVVLGDAYVDSALAQTTPFTAPLQELVTRHACGNTWQRQGIDPRTRSIVTVSMLVALGRMHELKIHVHGALNNGVTKEELQEIFLHASV
jgi:4-carboxymuconolactone decarboxylase